MLRKLLVGGLAVLAFAGAASAQETFTYTGNRFLYIGGCCGVSNVSGSFSVLSELSANTTYDLSSSVASYDFTDGRYSWTSSNNAGGNELVVTTGADGNIASWQINLNSNSPGGQITTESISYAVGGGVLDATNVFNNYDAYSYAPGNPNGEQGVSGTWTMTAAPVPEPESYAMLLAGLGLLGFAARRRKQNEAAAA